MLSQYSNGIERIRVILYQTNIRHGISIKSFCLAKKTFSDIVILQKAQLNVFSEHVPDVDWLYRCVPDVDIDVYTDVYSPGFYPDASSTDPAVIYRIVCIMF